MLISASASAGIGGGASSGSVKRNAVPHAGQALGPDAPAVQRDDRAADGEAEADAAAPAVVELVEDALEVALGQAGAEVLDRDHELAAARRCARRRTRVPAGVWRAAFSSRLPSACSISARVDAHQRQVVGQVDHHQVRRRGARCRRRSTDAGDLGERAPVALERERAALQARHLQHLGDQLGHRPAPAEDALRERARAPRRPGARRARRGSTRRPVITASGVRRSCEIEASSALRMRSVSASTASAACACARARTRLGEPRDDQARRRASWRRSAGTAGRRRGTCRAAARRRS